MAVPLHAGRRAGLLRAAELLAPAKPAAAALLARAVNTGELSALRGVRVVEDETHGGPLALGAHDGTLVEERARGLLPVAA